MLESQENITIPVAFIEAFVMMLVAFLIGYIGASLYLKWKYKKTAEGLRAEIEQLKIKLQEVKDLEENSSKGNYRQDRMDQDFEQVNFQRRAFSDKVIDQKTDAPNQVNFEKIGYAEAAHRDDLQKIAGIGPYTEAKLNDLGIYSYEQISKFEDEDIQLVTELIKFFPDRIKNDRWVQKANQLLLDKKQARGRESTDDGVNDLKKKTFENLN